MRHVAVCVLSTLIVACGPSSSGEGDNGGGGGNGVDGGGGNGDDGDWPDANAGGGQDDEFVDAAPAKACTKMDILFVVDDSESMSEEQTNLATNFPQFMTVIDEYQTQSGDLLDYHVAVTTTGRDMTFTFLGIPQTVEGDNGALRQDCGMSRRWLERDDADVASTFACAAEVGTGGPGLEMPLHAVDLAFGERMADNTNTGFLREDALLALVVLTDEDDCSRQDDNFMLDSLDTCNGSNPQIVDVPYYLDYLDQLKGDRGRWASAVIAGPGPGTCSSSFGDAAEAVRLKDFVDQTGQNAVFSSICEGDLTSALQDALNTFDEACETFPDID